jgi:hypothetical protein
VDVGAANDGGEGAEVGQNIGVFEFLDGVHGEEMGIRCDWWHRMGGKGQAVGGYAGGKMCCV